MHKATIKVRGLFIEMEGSTDELVEALGQFNMRAIAEMVIDSTLGQLGGPSTNPATRASTKGKSPARKRRPGGSASAEDTR